MPCALPGRIQGCSPVACLMLAALLLPMHVPSKCNDQPTPPARRRAGPWASAKTRLCGFCWSAAQTSPTSTRRATTSSTTREHCCPRLCWPLASPAVGAHDSCSTPLDACHQAACVCAHAMRVGGICARACYCIPLHEVPGGRAQASWLVVTLARHMQCK